jgi:CRISPR/Cas system CSM-associated protein Csm3 (group 7 of RAMP superfamily)
MRAQHDQLKLARVCLQLRSPMAIGSGLYDGLAVQPCVLDANGLPVIPATSLAGVLRSLMPAARRERLFGAAADVDLPENGASQLMISFAHIHDSGNAVVDGRVSRATLEQDAILAPLVATAGTKPLRDQVRINPCGTVDDMGKFERSIVPAGHRFSFELQLWHGKADAAQAQQDWQDLQQALQDTGFALGGGSRSGLGRIAIVNWCETCFDMCDPAHAQRFATLPVRLDQPASVLTAVKLAAPPSAASSARQAWEVWQLQLQFTDYWRIGRGLESIAPAAASAEEAADLLPLTQRVVQWQHCRGELARQLYLPASGIKGALRHRTEFYLRCMQLGNGKPDSENQNALEHDSGSLFGHIGSNDADLPGSAGRLMIEDVFLPLPTAPSSAHAHTIMHNSIDHFTQGTRDGALFGEEMLYQQSWQCKVALKPGATSSARQALQLALADVCQQRLALGAASARGHGYLQGTLCAMQEGNCDV